MAEVEQVLRGGARAAAIVDRDERDAGDVRRVGDDQRQVALERGVDARVILGQRVDEAAVDERAADGRGVGGVVGERRGQQAERDADALRLLGEAAQGGDGGGVAERVGELLGEQDADRAGAPGAQGPAAGVGPCIAQLGRRARARARAGPG